MDTHNRYREEELENSDNINTEDIDKEQVDSEDSNHEEENKEADALKAEIKRLNETILRNRADLENFKRRTNEERIKERKYALQDILTELVDVVDIFDSAVNVKTDDDKLKNFLVGFTMINSRYKQILEHYGVKKIEALNAKFDHTIHQAMEEEVNDDVEAGTIIRVMMNGYLYKDRVLKPSMVVVSKKSEEK